MVKKLLLIISVLFIYTYSYAQTLNDSGFNGYYFPITTVSTSGDTLTFQGAFTNEQGNYNGTEIDTTSVLIVETDGNCYYLPVVDVISAGSVTTASVIDLSGDLSEIPAGKAAISTPTDTLGLLAYSAGMTQTTLGCILNYNFVIIDSLTASIQATVAADTFDLSQPILRVPGPGDVFSFTGNTFSAMAAFYFYAPPTITCNLSPSTTVYEVGTSNSITISGATSNAGGSILSGGVLTRTVPSSNVINSFGTGTSYSTNITFSPTQGGTGDYNLLSYSFRATQAYTGTETGTATSTTRSVVGAYPYFYGMASTDTTAVLSDIYNNLNKVVETQGNKTVTLTGTGLIYFAFPASWSDTVLNSILAVSSGNVETIGSFTRSTNFTVTSDDRTNDYVAVPYIVYYLNTGVTTTAGEIYTFKL